MTFFIGFLCGIIFALMTMWLLGIFEDGDDDDDDFDHPASV